jgi:hypothetical protein
LSSLAPNMLPWLMMAASLLVPGTGPPSLVASTVPIGIAVSIMAPKPKPKGEWHDSVGPIPADNWDNDLPYNPDVDMTGYEELEKAAAATAAKARAKSKPKS